MAAGPESVTFFLENQAERRKSVFLFPLKMSPTFFWFLTQGLKPSYR